jgi:hypothetical protein
MQERQVIRAHWVARAIFYWVPLLFCYFGVVEYWQMPWAKGSPAEGIQSFVIAGVCVLLLELFIFGHKLTLTRDALVYQYLGFPLFLKRTIARDSIMRFTQGHYIRGKTPASYAKLTVMRGGRPTRLRLNLATFGPADTGALYRWLSESPR